MTRRYLQEVVLRDIKDKMVFICGPRQVGKTTFARQIGEGFFKNSYEYLNWDNRQDRIAILDGRFTPERKLLIFDEIHKYKTWKNYLKGEYDKKKEAIRIIVTGSARLDIFRKGGDSLLGRYHLHRLHPFSLREVSGLRARVQVPFKPLQFVEAGKVTQRNVARLLKFGGFPEIYTLQSEISLRRWHNERTERIVKGDIRDLESVRDISSLQLLAELLPGKVGSLFSLNSLREDIGVTHKTLRLWVEILEKFYYHYRIYPFQSSIIKSLRKEPKLYLWDWSEVNDEPARLENMVASHLLKFCHFFHDSLGYKAVLYFLRDKEQREVDFLVAIDNKPWFCLEVKSSHNDVSKALRYFRARLKIPFAYQLTRQEDVDYVKDNVRVMGLSKLLMGLV